MCLSHAEYKQPGWLLLHSTEQCQAKNDLTLSLKLSGLHQKLSLLRFQFSATNFLEIYRDQTKIYESEWFFNEPNHAFNPIKMTDARLSNNNIDTEIEFRLV